MRLPSHVAHRRLADETVLLNLESGMYHGLDGVGSDFLQALEAHKTVDAAAAALAHTYGVTGERVRGDMLKFCEGMKQRGLLVLDDDEH